MTTATEQQHDLKRFYAGISALKRQGVDLCDEANAKILDDLFTCSNVRVAIHGLPEDQATLHSYYREDYGQYFFLSPMQYKLQEVPAYEERGLRLRPAAYLVKQPSPMIFRESVVRQAKALHAATKDLKYVFIGACSRPELADKELNAERMQFIDAPDSDRASIRTWNDLQIFRRRWAVEFAKKHFARNCLFKDTACSAPLEPKKNYLEQEPHTAPSARSWPWLQSLGGCCLGRARGGGGGFEKEEEEEDEERTGSSWGRLGNPILGPFDVSHDVPHGGLLEQNDEYLRAMCRSQFTLCPGGDQPWSYRFFEAIMCKSIPIVENDLSTGRNKVERDIGYRYYKINEKHEFREEFVEENWQLFCAHHLLPGAVI